MNIDDFLQELRAIEGVVLHDGADEADILALEKRYGILLPEFHRDLLLRTNGIEIRDGYFRIFGVGPSAAIDMASWNDLELWKFAWPSVARSVLCFAEDPWGNQVGYRVEEISSRETDALLYFLPTTGKLVPLGSSMRAFFESAFLMKCRGAANEFDRRLRDSLGPLAPSEHVVLSPPMLLGGRRSVKNTLKMPAAMAMVIEGDVSMDYLRISQNLTYFDFEIVGLEPYVDEKGRGRMRIVTTDDVLPASDRDQGSRP